MEQEQLDEKDEILLVYDHDDKKVSAVKGIDREGNLQTVPAAKEHQSEFLKVNTHGDPLENFITNFNRQLNAPTRFTFFTSRLHVVEKAAKAFLEIFKSGIREQKINEINKQIDTLIQKQQKMEAQMQKPAPAAEKEQAPPYRFNPEKIDWDSLKKFGITKENLPEKTLDTLLKGNKSDELHRVTAHFGQVTLQTDARLSFRHLPDGSVALAIHGVRRQPELDKPFFGHQFSEEDRKNLLETGHMGRLAETKDFRTNETNLVYISVDKLTNEVVALKAEHIRLPEEIKGVPLNEEQKQQLHEGKAVFVEGMTSKTGKEFSAYIQINADKRGLEFRFDHNQKQEQSQQNGKQVFIPQKMGGVALTAAQQSDLREGKTVYVENMTDKKGVQYSAYVKVNDEKGKLDFYRKHPDSAQKEEKAKAVKPDNTPKKQAETRSESRKSEADKKIDEIFPTAQTKPKEAPEAAKPKKAKGHKI